MRRKSSHGFGCEPEARVRPARFRPTGGVPPRRTSSTSLAFRAHPSPASRRGSVLLAVLVIILLLTFGVYGFTERMLAEKAAATAHGTTAKARAAADSGVALALTVVDSGNLNPAAPPAVYHEPALFRGE